MHWEGSLEWWRGRCSFCVGRGLPQRYVMHTLRDCKRRPVGLFNSELAAAFYQKNILSPIHCENCGTPPAFCRSWARDDDGEWVMASPGQYWCQHTKNYISDIILGLYYCGRSEFQDTMVDYYSNWDFFFGSVTEERVARYLARQIMVEGVASSQMMRVMGFLTRDIWDLVGKDL